MSDPEKEKSDSYKGRPILGPIINCGEQKTVVRRRQNREACGDADPLSRYLCEIGMRRMVRLSDRTEIPLSKIHEWRSNPLAPIRYLQGLRIVQESAGMLTMEEVLKRNVTDREKYDNPLGRKIAQSLLLGSTLTSLLDSAGISHNQFNRWLTENTKWTQGTKAKLRKAFERGEVVLTDDDFEDHYVDRLRSRYLKAKEDLEKRRVGRAVS